MLQWLAFSARPLKLRELAEVLAIDINETLKFDPQRRLADPHDVVEICSSLVTVTSSRVEMEYEPHDILTKSIVTLAHFSVREYLISEVIIQGQALKFSLRELDCHVSLAKDCLAYLIHFDVAVTDSEEEIFAEYPLLLYAAKHLTKHAQMAEKRDSTLCKDFFFKMGEAFFNWIRLCNPDVSSSPYLNMKSRSSSGNFASSLYYASLAGLFETVKTLCDMGADVNAIGGNFETALIATSCKEHIEIANLLLEKGARVNFESSCGTVLQIAVEKGSTEILRQLLEHGAEVNFIGPVAHAALYTASANGRTKVVRLLLEYGANVDINGGDTALLIASKLGHIEIVRLLLDHGADVDLVGSFGTALRIASVYGHTEIVRLVLEHGANVNVVHRHFGTTLQEASIEGRTETVRLLLKHGANVNITGSFYGTALEEASSKGNTEIVRLLLDHGAYLHHSGRKDWESSRYALELASHAGHLEIEEMLAEEMRLSLHYSYSGILIGW